MPPVKYIFAVFFVVAVPIYCQKVSKTISVSSLSSFHLEVYHHRPTYLFIINLPLTLSHFPPPAPKSLSLILIFHPIRWLGGYHIPPAAYLDLQVGLFFICFCLSNPNPGECRSEMARTGGAVAVVFSLCIATRMPIISESAVMITPISR